jgi:sugar lactone lactonase YvrE
MVVSVHEGRILRYEGDKCRLVADVGAIYRGGLNDMLTTPGGQSYVSAFPAPPAGEIIADVPADGGQVPLFMVTQAGDVRVVAEKLKIPNGIAQSPDGRELFVAETMARRILAFAILADGSLGRQRTFADLGQRMPDGLSMDSRGRLWVGSPFTSEFVRLNTAGAIDEVVETPGRWAVSCAVGDNDDLYCGTVRTTIEDYKQGKSSGAIERWWPG